MKNKKTWCKNFAGYGDFLIRVVVGMIFLVAGFGKMFGGLGAFANNLGNIGFPIPGFFAFLVALIELVGGLLLILGLWTSIPSLLLAFIMLVAIVTVHAGMGFNGVKYPLLMLVASLRYVGTAGYWSLESYFKKKK